MYADRFIRYLKFEKRYSPNTIEAYENDLQQFFQFIQEEYRISDIGDISHQFIRSWIVNMLNNSYSSVSVNRKISTLKSFYRFLNKENVISEDPLVKILPPKTNKSLPEFVDKEKMDMLFDKIAYEDNFEGVRNKLILEFLYFTGMRLSELIEITDNNIDLIHLRLKVLGKRNKERLIPFSNELKKSIIRYTELRNTSIIKPGSNNYFFVTKKGNKLYKKFVYRIVNLHLGKVSTISKKSPHVLRHTFATHMLNNGADLNSIKEILGHASLAATQVYTHNTIEKLKHIYNQAHPRA